MTITHLGYIEDESQFAADFLKFIGEQRITGFPLDIDQVNDPSYLVSTCVAGGKYGIVADILFLDKQKQTLPYNGIDVVRTLDMLAGMREND